MTIGIKDKVQEQMFNGHCSRDNEREREICIIIILMEYCKTFYASLHT